MKILLVVLSIMITLSGCSSQPARVGENIVGPVENSSYKPVVKKFSHNEKEYSGFHNTYQATMTILNSEVQNLALQRRGHFLQWSLEKAREEREKMFQEMSQNTKVFLAFYSPENDYDDLDKPKSIWKIYLEFEGERYEGKVKKANEKFVELKELFPYMERFHSPYYVSFNIPMTAIESKKLKVILTSSLGNGEFPFPGIQQY